MKNSKNIKSILYNIIVVDKWFWTFKRIKKSGVIPELSRLQRRTNYYQIILSTNPHNFIICLQTFTNNLKNGEMYKEYEWKVFDRNLKNVYHQAGCSVVEIP